MQVFAFLRSRFRVTCRPFMLGNYYVSIASQLHLARISKFIVHNWLSLVSVFCQTEYGEKHSQKANVSILNSELVWSFIFPAIVSEQSLWPKLKHERFMMKRFEIPSRVIKYQPAKVAFFLETFENGHVWKLWYKFFSNGFFWQWFLRMFTSKCLIRII